MDEKSYIALLSMDGKSCNRLFNAWKFIFDVLSRWYNIGKERQEVMQVVNAKWRIDQNLEIIWMIGYEKGNVWEDL